MTGRGRKLARAVFAPVSIGLVGLFSLMERPRFAGYHTVDVVQLFASGMCFGVALAAVFMIYRPSRTQV